jgi:hypothetical protein
MLASSGGNGVCLHRHRWVWMRLPRRHLRAEQKQCETNLFNGRFVVL